MLIALNGLTIPVLRAQEKLKKTQKEKIPSDEQIQDAAEMEAVLRHLDPICFRPQHAEFTSSELWIILKELQDSLRGPFKVVAVQTQQSRTITLSKREGIIYKDVRRSDLREMAKCAVKRLEDAIFARFKEPDDNVLLAILLDPRTAMAADAILGNNADETDNMLLERAQKLLREAVENALIAKLRYEREKVGSESEEAAATRAEGEDAEDIITINDETETGRIRMPQCFIAGMTSPASAASRQRESTFTTQDEYISKKIPGLIDDFRKSCRTFRPLENLASGSTGSDLRDRYLASLLRHTSIKKWAMKIKPDQPVFFHLMQTYLGTVEASSFVETLFSTAGNTWERKNIHLNPCSFESATILQKARKLTEMYNRQWQSEKI